MVEVTIYMTPNDKESYQKSTVHRKNERFVTICPNIKNIYIYIYIYRSHKSIVHFFLVSDFCWKECSHSFDTAHTHIGLVHCGVTCPFASILEFGMNIARYRCCDSGRE